MSQLIRPTLPTAVRGPLNDARSTLSGSRGRLADTLALRGTAPVSRGK